jgi:hypothetical protein
VTKRKVVAESGLTRIEVCPCGGCQLSIGPVTVTVHEALLEELGETVAIAVRAIRERRARHPALTGERSCDDPEPAATDPSDPN